MISPDKIQELYIEAKAARAKAYAPYSGYKVGAAILAKSGKIYRGCNIENASYGATICAERSALAAFVQAGEDKPEAIAIVAEGDALPYPCGICRQVLSEWGGETLVLVFDEKGGYRQHTMAELLPYAFTLKEEKD